MNEPDNSETTSRQISIQPDFRISVTNFGPIESGTVDLRPMTVFVGPSNTGKTYFAILIYALRRVLGGFPRLPVVSRHSQPYFFLDTNLSGSHALTEEWELQNIIAKLETEGRPFRFSDFPESLRETALIALIDPDSLGAVLSIELERCFDIEKISDLVRFPLSASMKIGLMASEATQNLWSFGMDVSDSEITTDGRIDDMVLLPEGWSAEELGMRRALHRFHELLEEIRRPDAMLDSPFLLDFFEEHIHASTANWRGDTHYLPAARSGIMQSHRVIASSLVARSTRGGLERFPELPTFSGVMADFMQRLILYEENRGRKDSIGEAADALEREALAGQIISTRPQTGGYPEFVYRPIETEEDIRLTRASSMVSELAPVVLFLRGAVSPGDMLIIEEPEAHLHPAAQTQMARILARLVRAGVRVVVTTHSDWLLMEIANLMREGELEELTKNQAGDTSRSSSLLPNEVGVWLFREDGDASGSTIEEIPFDRSEGIEPQEYENVAEALYNRSATLQNRFQELAGAAEREQE